MGGSYNVASSSSNRNVELQQPVASSSSSSASKVRFAEIAPQRDVCAPRPDLADLREPAPSAMRRQQAPVNPPAIVPPQQDAGYNMSKAFMAHTAKGTAVLDRVDVMQFGASSIPNADTETTNLLKTKMKLPDHASTENKDALGYFSAVLTVADAVDTGANAVRAVVQQRIASKDVERNPDADLKGTQAEMDLRIANGKCELRPFQVARDDVNGMVSLANKIDGYAHPGHTIFTGGKAVETPAKLALHSAASAASGAGTALGLVSGVSNVVIAAKDLKKQERTAKRSFAVMHSMNQPRAQFKRAEGIQDEFNVEYIKALATAKPKKLLSKNACNRLLQKSPNDRAAFVAKFNALSAADQRKLNDALHFSKAGNIAHMLSFGRNARFDSHEQRDIARDKVLNAFIDEVDTRANEVDFSAVKDARELALGGRGLSQERAVKELWREKAMPLDDKGKPAHKNIVKALAGLPKAEAAAFMDKFLALPQQDRTALLDVFHFSSDTMPSVELRKPTLKKPLPVKVSTPLKEANSTSAGTERSRWLIRKSLAHEFVNGTPIERLSQMRAAYNKRAAGPVESGSAAGPTYTVARHICAFQEVNLDTAKEAKMHDKFRLVYGSANVAIAGATLASPAALALPAAAVVTSAVSAGWGGLQTYKGTVTQAKGKGVDAARDPLKEEAAGIAQHGGLAKTHAFLQDPKVRSYAATPADALSQLNFIDDAIGSGSAHQADDIRAEMDEFLHSMGVDPATIEGGDAGKFAACDAHRQAYVQKVAERNPYVALSMLTDSIHSNVPHGSRDQAIDFLREKCHFTEWELDDLQKMDTDTMTNTLEKELYGEHMRRRFSDFKMDSASRKNLGSIHMDIAMSPERTELNQEFGWKGVLEKSGVRVTPNAHAPGVESVTAALAQSFTGSSYISDTKTSNAMLKATTEVDKRLAADGRRTAFDGTNRGHLAAVIEETAALLKPKGARVIVKTNVTGDRLHYPADTTYENADAVLYYDEQSRRAYVLDSPKGRQPGQH